MERAHLLRNVEDATPVTQAAFLRDLDIERIASNHFVHGVRLPVCTSSDEQEHSKNGGHGILQSPAGFLRRSFDDGPVIIAGVAAFSEQSDPAVRIIMELGGEHPFLKQRLLLSSAIGVDLHEGAPWRQSLDFAERGDAFAAVQIVHRIERYHRLEALVGKRQLDGIAEMEPADDLRLAMHQRIFRNVEAEGFEAGTDLDQVLDQEALAAAYVEHAIAGLEIEVLHHVLGDRNPSTVVAISAIAVLARSIEIELAIFARDRDDLVRLGLSAGIDVTLAARKLRKQIDFLLHPYTPSLATRASPSRSGI